MLKVTTRAGRKVSFSFLLFILLFLSGCKYLNPQTGVVMTSYNIPQSSINEIEMLVRQGYMTDETRYHIYMLMTKQCMLAEYQGIPCVYPQINYPSNNKAIK